MLKLFYFTNLRLLNGKTVYLLSFQSLSKCCASFFTRALRQKLIFFQSLQGAPIIWARYERVTFHKIWWTNMPADKYHRTSNKHISRQNIGGATLGFYFNFKIRIHSSEFSADCNINSGWMNQEIILRGTFWLFI